MPTPPCSGSILVSTFAVMIWVQSPLHWAVMLCYESPSSDPKAEIACFTTFPANVTSLTLNNDSYILQ